MNRITKTCTALFAATFAGQAIADDQIFVGGPDGAIYVADSDTGEFTYFACFCIGPVVSIQPLGSDMLVADSFGVIWTLNGQTGDFVTGVWTSHGMKDMAIDGNEAIVVTDGNQLIRIDLATGNTIETITTPAPVTTVLLFDGAMYVGSTDNNIYRLLQNESEWSIFGTLTTAIKTLAARPEALVAADELGQAILIDWAGAPDDGYYVTPSVIDASYTGDFTLFTQAPGTVDVYDAATSLLVDTWTVPVPVSAIFVRPGSVCKADTNRNGVLEAGDLTAWIAAYNRGDYIADQNNDLALTPTDFSAWIAAYNQGCE